MIRGGIRTSCIAGLIWRKRKIDKDQGRVVDQLALFSYYYTPQTHKIPH